MRRVELLKEEILFEKYGKKWLKRDFRLPDEEVASFYCFGGSVSVIVFPLTKDNEVVAIEQFRFGANRMLIEIPGGNKGDSTSEDCAIKELAEETGYVPRKIHIFKEVWIDPASVTVPFIPALATGCKKTNKTSFDRMEVICKTVLIPLKKWQDMILTGEINDSKTIATTFLALRHLGL